MSVMLIGVSHDTVVNNKHAEQTRHYYLNFQQSSLTAETSFCSIGDKGMMQPFFGLNVTLMLHEHHRQSRKESKESFKVGRRLVETSRGKRAKSPSK